VNGLKGEGSKILGKTELEINLYPGVG